MKQIVTCTLVLCTYFLTAQNRTIDSLKVILKTAKEDTSKVKTLNSLSENFNTLYKSDSALYYTNVSAGLAEKIKYKKGEGTAMSIRASAFFNKGNTAEALKLYPVAIKLLEESGDKNKLAAALLNFGTVNIRTGNFVVAREKADAALKLYKELNNKLGMATAYTNLGSIEVSTGKYKEAAAYFELTQKMQEELNNKAGVANCLNNIALMQQYQGNYSDAVVKHSAALKLRQEIGDKNGQGISHLNIGLLLYNKSEYIKAKTEFILAAKFAEEVGNKTVQAGAQNNLGAIYMELGDWVNSLSILKSVLKTREDINDRVGIGQSLMNIGANYLKQNKYREALGYFNQSLKVHKEISDLKNTALVYNNIGIVYQFQGNYPLALQNYNLSLKLKQEIGDKAGIVQSYNNMGTVYFFQGNFTEAIKNFENSLKMSEALGDKKGMSVNQNNIGMLYNEKAQYDNALKHYKLAFALKKEIGDKEGLGITHNNIGDIYMQQKKFNEALFEFNEAARIGDELKDKSLKATAEQNLGNVNLQRDQPAEAKKHALSAEAAAKELRGPELIRKCERLLAKIYIKENNLPEAEKYMRELLKVCDKGLTVNFPIMSEKEQEDYFNTLLPSYMAFNSLALLSKEKNPAITEVVYNSAVRNKGMLLKSSSAMRNAILNSKDTALISHYQEWITIKKQIAKLYSDGKDANELEEKSNQLEKNLVKNSQAFSSFDKAQKITWKNVQEGLKKEETAVEFIHFNTNDKIGEDPQTVYCALIVKPSSKHPEMVRLFQANELEKILGQFSQNNAAYVDSAYGTNSSPQTKLYNLIWKPIEQNLSGSKTVYLSPSGLLHKISFSALCKSRNVYLCDNYKLQIQSSTGKVAHPESYSVNEKSKVTLFGGIDYNSTVAPSDSNSFMTWNYLDGTKSEAEKIFANLKKNNFDVKIYEEKLASEKEFKNDAPESNILHIATHGFFFPDQDEVRKQEAGTENKNQNSPKIKSGDTIASRGVEYGFGVWSFIMNKNPLMRSGLVFAGANAVWNQADQTEEEDGVLTAQEVSNLDLRKTDLVVLSACETGLGDIKGSEGVYGLQRSFKMAGAKYIIMSLWQVPDAETEEFMILFYKQMVALKDVKKAFTETQITMRKKYDPFFWAPFVLVE